MRFAYQEFDLEGLLAGEEAQYAGASGGMEEDTFGVAMQFAKPQGPRVMSSAALAAAQEIVGGEEEDDEDDELS